MRAYPGASEVERGRNHRSKEGQAEGQEGIAASDRERGNEGGRDVVAEMERD